MGGIVTSYREDLRRLDRYEEPAGVERDRASDLVPVRRGENGGLTLPHKNVVREVVDLGAWDGGAHAYALPPASRPGLKTAVLIQEGPGGPILAATHD